MQDYFTFTKLIGLRDQNLPLYRDSRLQRYKSVKKMMDLIEIGKKTCPILPRQVQYLDQFDPQWDDLMPFPYVDYSRYIKLGGAIGVVVWFYSYNYNAMANSVRFRSFRNIFPLMIGFMVYSGYYKYKLQILKINLFDEYCYLRSQELIKQNQFLFKSQLFQKYVWWKADFLQTCQKIYRQANDNKSSDFKDSELLLQDFINRYVDPNDKSPMKKFARGI